MIPQQFTSLESALCSLFGEGTKVEGTRPISGGDINEAYGLTLTGGERIFMKTNTRDNLPLFAAEAVGLTAIARTEAIGTPHILGMGTDEGRGGYSFLLLEFISGKSRSRNYWESFARQLADMHRASTDGLVSGGKYGFDSNNYIGRHSQINTVRDSWTSFFRDCRLEPQFLDAASYFDRGDQRRISRFLDHVDEMLVEPEHPSLLHGDLWSGNVITGNDGSAWLIDPAVYVGHAEADIAMTELFGGFPPAFYDAYREAAPLQPGYERRRDVYNLYHLLNHLNLFGRMYLPEVKRIVGRMSAI
ncbi:MAG: fructosamine kinase family protein [Lachnospiraceae bacterium]|nr:fructosamine kinase family protein [Lachnospiraceae bacterium]